MNPPNSPDTTAHEGGCFCGAIRFRATAEPSYTTICHCTFCQRLTGSAFLVEPIFKRAHVVLSGEPPKVYERRSDGSGKTVRVNFCGHCGVTLFLSFERFPDLLGLCGGAFDDPNWFDRGPGKGRHIFTCTAQAGVVLPPHVELYDEHILRLDGTLNTPRVYSQAVVVADGGTRRAAGRCRRDGPAGG